MRIKRVPHRGFRFLVRVVIIISWMVLIPSYFLRPEYSLFSESTYGGLNQLVNSESSGLKGLSLKIEEV